MRRPRAATARRAVPVPAGWIDLHATPEFVPFVGWLREELDRELAAGSPSRTQRIERPFRRTAELERDFFDAAYDA